MKAVVVGAAQQPTLLPVAASDRPSAIPAGSSHVFLDHREANQTGNILDPFPKITKSCTSVHAVLVGVDVTLELPGIRH